MRSLTSSIVAAALVAAALVWAPPAMAVSDTVAINMKFVTPSGKPYTGYVQVQASGAATDAVGGQSASAASGTAIISNLSPASAVRLSFDTSLSYLRPSARNLITPTSGSVTLKFVIAKGATISGTVKSSVGTPLQYIPVRILKGERIVATEITASNGAYRVYGLPTGTYRVQFNAPAVVPGEPTADYRFVWRYWKGAATWAASDRITVKQQTATSRASNRTGINAALRVGKRLTVTTDFADTTQVFVQGSHFAEAVTVPTPLPNDPADPTNTRYQVALAPGKYRILLYLASGPAPQLWWTGNTTEPTTDPSKAKLLTFTGTSNQTITIPAP